MPLGSKAELGLFFQLKSQYFALLQRLQKLIRLEHIGIPAILR